jgi:hypothetical protein
VAAKQDPGWRRTPSSRTRSVPPRNEREIAMKRLLRACVVVVLASAGAAFAQGAKRPLSLDDLGKLKDVRDPQCASSISHDGGRLAGVQRVRNRRLRCHPDGARQEVVSKGSATFVDIVLLPCTSRAASLHRPHQGSNIGRWPSCRRARAAWRDGCARLRGRLATA